MLIWTQRTFWSETAVEQKVWQFQDILGKAPQAISNLNYMKRQERPLRWQEERREKGPQNQELNKRVGYAPLTPMALRGYEGRVAAPGGIICWSSLVQASSGCTPSSLIAGGDGFFCITPGFRIPPSTRALSLLRFWVNRLVFYQPPRLDAG